MPKSKLYQQGNKLLANGAGHTDVEEAAIGQMDYESAGFENRPQVQFSRRVGHP